MSEEKAVEHQEKSVEHAEKGEAANAIKEHIEALKEISQPDEPSPKSTPDPIVP